MKIKYNDNELLYLISEYDESAFELLCEKYRPLIISRLTNFKIQEKNFSDFYQECLMVLYKCSWDYREDKNYTFNAYLDMSIQNKIRNLLRKERNYFYNVSLLDVETIDAISFKETTNDYKVKDVNQLNLRFSSLMDKKVVELYNEGYTIKDICQELECSNQKVYYILRKYRPKTTGQSNEENKGIYSSFEKRVYDLYVNDYRPREIARILDCEIESVYNAIKRIKLKNKKLNNFKKNKH